MFFTTNYDFFTIHPATYRRQGNSCDFQLNFYVTAVNKTLKKEIDNETIGLLLCKEKDKLSVEWALDGISNPIGVSSYKIKDYIPKDILDKLPSEEDINMYINMDDK